ncbi:hypothetical protein K0M31_019420 [Melipona bicolor]|uniref:Uncharacterized protein n=1 Tax=Melipona bicolor TaxID=60889 RepID=A0AA40KR30_9HYME|nr:hypothetical protein K0M31_019420 [Melipona bicolor]
MGFSTSVRTTRRGEFLLFSILANKSLQRIATLATLRTDFKLSVVLPASNREEWKHVKSDLERREPIKVGTAAEIGALENSLK